LSWQKLVGLGTN